MGSLTKGLTLVELLFSKLVGGAPFSGFCWSNRQLLQQVPLGIMNRQNWNEKVEGIFKRSCKEGCWIRDTEKCPRDSWDWNHKETFKKILFFFLLLFFNLQCSVLLTDYPFTTCGKGGRIISPRVSGLKKKTKNLQSSDWSSGLFFLLFSGASLPLPCTVGGRNGARGEETNNLLLLWILKEDLE